MLFFSKRLASKEVQTRELWIYDFRTNIHFTLKTNPLKSDDLDDFVQCFRERQETERFRRFSYDDLIKRDKLNLDLFWLKDDSLQDLDHLPAPEVIASEIVENLQAAPEQFTLVAEALGKKGD